MFINDIYSKAPNPNGRLQTEDDGVMVETLIKMGASLDRIATIMGSVTIGECALVGAGAVVTKDVPDHVIVACVPAQIKGDVRNQQKATI